MVRSWIEIRVELVGGRGERLWPRPGRIIGASRRHTFEQLSTAIDDAFARWDRAHLWAFRFPGALRIEIPDLEWEPLGEVLDGRRTRLSRLKPGEQFAYEFDFGDAWMHLCTVGDKRIDPLETLGIYPETPLPFWGWGDIPDQYGRRWDGDDGESPVPSKPRRVDLPSSFPW
jgi:Plasmid pRiA4b ORF-3-like protein